MSKSSSSLLTRLQGIFNKPSANAAATATATATATPTAIAVEQNLRNLEHKAKKPLKEKRLQNLVERFKKASESPRFRRRHGLYSALVRRLNDAKQFSLIDDFLQHHKKFEDDITEEDFVIRLMLFYGYSGMAEHAHKLFDEMPQLNCERTVKSFNALLSSYVNSRMFEEAEKVMREVPEELGISPDLVTYNTMIKAFCKLKSLEKMRSMMQEMEKNGIEPDRITFNTLLESFYKRGQFSEGERLWALMESKNVVPDIRSYNSRMRGLVKVKKMSNAVELIGEMRSKGIEPGIHSYNALVVGYCEDGDMDEALKWYRELKEKGHKPDAVTYSVLVPLVCNKGDLDKAIELSKEAIENQVPKNQVPLRPSLFKPAIEALVNNSRVEEAIELVRLGKFQSYFRYISKLADM